MTVTPQDLIVLKDSPFELSCKVAAHPRYKAIQWKQGEGAGEVVLTDSEVLRVEPGLSTDGALYTCSVENDLGSGSNQARVTVQCE